MVKARGWHQHYSEPELKTAKSLEKKKQGKKKKSIRLFAFRKENKPFLFYTPSFQCDLISDLI